MYKLEPLVCITDDINKYGGKAVYLSKLIKNNFLVPYGVVIPSCVYKDYKTSKLDENIFSNIITQLENLFLQENKSIIFRSSSNVENSDEYSSAGVFSSFRYNSEISVKEHIEKVWQSSEDIYADEYINFVEIDKSTITMGVIVQEYIEGNLTLVIQSYDIINDSTQILVEYSDNGTSSIVDGTANADLLYIDYDGKFINGQKCDILSARILNKIASDCKRMEEIFSAHVEVEAQVLGEDIYYLQVRKLL
mgnify:CR=1 FL=1